MQTTQNNLQHTIDYFTRIKTNNNEINIKVNWDAEASNTVVMQICEIILENSNMDTGQKPLFKVASIRKTKIRVHLEKLQVTQELLVKQTGKKHTQKQAQAVYNSYKLKKNIKGNRTVDSEG